jgi:hypothetical protein
MNDIISEIFEHVMTEACGGLVPFVTLLESQCFDVSDQIYDDPGSMTGT